MPTRGLRATRLLSLWHRVTRVPSYLSRWIHMVTRIRSFLPASIYRFVNFIDAFRRFLPSLTLLCRVQMCETRPLSSLNSRYGFCFTLHSITGVSQVLPLLELLKTDYSWRTIVSKSLYRVERKVLHLWFENPAKLIFFCIAFYSSQK